MPPPTKPLDPSSNTPHLLSVGSWVCWDELISWIHAYSISQENPVLQTLQRFVPDTPPTTTVDRRKIPYALFTWLVGLLGLC